MGLSQLNLDVGYNSLSVKGTSQHVEIGNEAAQWWFLQSLCKWLGVTVLWENRSLSQTLSEGMGSSWAWKSSEGNRKGLKFLTSIFLTSFPSRNPRKFLHSFLHHAFVGSCAHSKCTSPVCRGLTGPVMSVILSNLLKGFTKVPPWAGRHSAVILSWNNRNILQWG